MADGYIYIYIRIRWTAIAFSEPNIVNNATYHHMLAASNRSTSTTSDYPYLDNRKTFHPCTIVTQSPNQSTQGSTQYNEHVFLRHRFPQTRAHLNWLTFAVVQTHNPIVKKTTNFFWAWQRVGFSERASMTAIPSSYQKKKCRKYYRKMFSFQSTVHQRHVGKGDTGGDNPNLHHIGKGNTGGDTQTCTSSSDRNWCNDNIFPSSFNLPSIVSVDPPKKV